MTTTDTCDHGSHTLATIEYRARRAAAYIGRHRRPRSDRARWALALTPLYLAALLAAYMVLTGGHHDPAPAPATVPAPLTLTLADAHGWTPTATLDATQVEQGDEWPLGAAIDGNLIADTVLAVDVAAQNVAWAAWLVDAGWVPAGQPIDDHDDCYLLIGDTTDVWCADDYRTTS